MHERRAFVLAAFLTAALAPPVSAGTVGLEDVGYCTDLWAGCRGMENLPGVVLRYGGGPWESNTVTVRRSGDGLAVTDVGARLVPGAHCDSTGEGTAQCDPGTRKLVGWRLEGGDGADTITIAESLSPTYALGQPHVLDGGPGEDMLAGGADADVVVGGLGADRLYGGEGDDRFLSETGTSGATTAVADDAAPDHVDGGPGFDTADYSPRTRPLEFRVRGPSWWSGTEEALDRIEQIVGGSGHDVFVGTPAGDHLDGYSGDDRIDGGSGDDELLGGEGSDTISGGDGDDRIGSAEHATCGRGNDIIGNLVVDWTGLDVWTGTSAGDVIALDCERVRWGFEHPRSLSSLDPRPVRRGRRQWFFRNPCAPTTIARCEGRLALSQPGRSAPLAVTTFKKSGLVKVRLGKRAARRLARARQVGLAYEFDPEVQETRLNPFVIAVR